jgi:hypothetical protein
MNRSIDKSQFDGPIPVQSHIIDQPFRNFDKKITFFNIVFKIFYYSVEKKFKFLVKALVLKYFNKFIKSFSLKLSNDKAFERLKNEKKLKKLNIFKF